MLVGGEDGQDVHQAKAQRGWGDEERRRSREALGIPNVRGPAGPRERDALRIVDGQRDRAGHGSGFREPAIDQIEEIARGVASSADGSSGARVHRNPEGHAAEHVRHAIEVAPDLPLDARRGGGLIRTEPPQFNRGSAQRGKQRQQKTGRHKPARADAPVAQPPKECGGH